MESQFSGQSGRFAILTHDHPFFHWDLLLEAGETCWTWRLVEGPRAEGLGPRAREEEEGRGLGDLPETAATVTPSQSPGGRGEPAADSDHPPSAMSHPPANSSTAHCQLPTPLDIERIANHRLLYLDYEGPVSGGRGHVTRWDWGEYRVSGETDSEITVDLRGQHSIWAIRLPLAMEG